MHAPRGSTLGMRVANTLLRFVSMINYAAWLPRPPTLPPTVSAPPRTHGQCSNGKVMRDASAIAPPQKHPTHRISASIDRAVAFLPTSSNHGFVVITSVASLKSPDPPWLQARTLYLKPSPGTRCGILTGCDTIVGYHGWKTGFQLWLFRRLPRSSSS